MTHAELVLAATALVECSDNPEKWLERYDTALASADDAALEALVRNF